MQNDQLSTRRQTASFSTLSLQFRLVSFRSENATVKISKYLELGRNIPVSGSWVSQFLLSLPAVGETVGDI